MEFVVDKMVELVELMDRMGLMNSVVLAVFSDHGEEFYEHGSHGHRHDSLHEEVLRVPLLLASDLFELPRVWEGRVQLLDVAPTLLRAAGVRVPLLFRGSPLTDVTPDVSRTVFAESAVPGMYAARFDVSSFFVCVVKGGWKLVCERRNGKSKVRLFDLERDPAERREVYEENPDVVSELKGELRKHLREVLGLRRLLLAASRLRAKVQGLWSSQGDNAFT